MEKDKKYEEQLGLLYSKIGLIVHLSQMVEYTLSNILSFDKIINKFDEVDSMCIIEFNDLVDDANNMYVNLSRISLGKILKEARKNNFFTEESKQLLEEMINKRNYVIHKLFIKDLLDNNIIENNPTYYYNILDDTIEILNLCNNDLNEIFRKQKEKYKQIY